MAVKGESFSTKGKQAKKMTRRLCPIGSYDLKLRTDKAEVKKSEASGRSRVSVAFEALKSDPDGGKNFFVYHDFHLGLTPGKDGTPMVERANQLVGFARASGTDFNVPTVNVTVTPDPKDPDTQITERALNAQEVLKILKGLDGTIVKGQVKHEQRQGANQLDDEGKPIKDARIAYFEESAESEEEDEEDDEEGDEDEDEETDEDEDADEDEDEEPAPAKKKKSKK
jgi:hypothetical protein